MVAALGMVVAGASGSAASALGASVPATVTVGASPRLPAGSSVLGKLPGSTPMAIAVAGGAPRDPAALARYATDVSTPGTEAFHHYLTVTEFRQRFAPAPSQIAAVQASLRAQGLNPGGVSSNGLLIQVSSTAGQLSRAFSGSFERVRLRSGRIAVANTQAPRLAGSVAAARPLRAPRG